MLIYYIVYYGVTLRYIKQHTHTSTPTLSLSHKHTRTHTKKTEMIGKTKTS
uniref:Uncharacterized protein n=1 Tax=Anguilla anguilla TaxID=7936 RepID=A0A0E9W752_ANGAN